MLIPDQLVEIERPVPHGPGAVWALTDQKKQLLAEVKRLHNELEAAEEDSATLRALEAAGVDNWGGYEHAMELRDEGEASC